MRRGEIWWAKLPLPAGRRPVVLEAPIALLQSDKLTALDTALSFSLGLA